MWRSSSFRIRSLRFFSLSSSVGLPKKSAKVTRDIHERFEQRVVLRRIVVVLRHDMSNFMVLGGSRWSSVAEV